MKPRNRHGTPVDPVPFVVVAGLSVLVSFSFGPIYFLTLGFTRTTSLVVPGFVCVLAVAVAYHRFVRTYRPALRAEIPPEDRVRRLIYGAIIGVAVLAALSIPLLAG